MVCLLGAHVDRRYGLAHLNLAATSGILDGDLVHLPLEVAILNDETARETCDEDHGDDAPGGP